jgi:integrase
MPTDPAPRLPKYHHYKPKGLAVVRIDGRDIYLGKYGSPESREKYLRIISEWNLSGAVPGPEMAPTPSDPAHTPLTVSELILMFWKQGETYYRRADGTPTGELDNYRLALRPLKALFGGTTARDFGPMSLKLVRQSMIDSGLSRGVVNRRIQRIVRLFAFGVENEVLPKDAHHALKAVKALGKGRSGARETEPIRPVPDTHVEATKPFLSRQLGAVVDLQRLTGMRSSEVLIMRTGDIDRGGDVWEYVPGRHKGEHRGKERRVFLGPKAQAVVREWLRANPTEFLFQPREARQEWLALRRANRNSPMTPSQRARKPKAKPKRAPGDCYDARAYGHAVAKACKRAGVPPWHPHQLRHNAGTWLRKEFGIEVARVILGHNSPVVTAIYAEADREQAREVMRHVG